MLHPTPNGPWPTLSHWGRVTNLTIIGSDNGLSPERRQANVWTNAGILLIGTLGTNFSEILSKIHSFSFKKMHLKTSSAKRRPFCLGLNVLRHWKCIYYSASPKHQIFTKDGIKQSFLVAGIPLKSFCAQQKNKISNLWMKLISCVL